MTRPLVFSDEYTMSGAYICTCDLDQREQKVIETVNGEVTLFTPQKYNNNHRTAHPNIGVIVEVYGNAEFKVGQEIWCKQFTFQTEEKRPKPYYEKDGVMYFKVYNGDVMFAINGEEMIPREGVVLSEPILDKLVNTTLEVSADFIDYRRDVVKILKSWDEELYPTGKYLFLEKGGDYHFTFNGKDYVKSDDYFDDIMAVIDSPDWRNTEVLTHAKGHSEMTDRNT